VTWIILLAAMNHSSEPRGALFLERLLCGQGRNRSRGIGVCCWCFGQVEARWFCEL